MVSLFAVMVLCTVCFGRVRAVFQRCFERKKKSGTVLSLGFLRGGALPHSAQLHCADGGVLPCTIHLWEVGGSQLLFVVPSESNLPWAAQSVLNADS